MTGGERGWEGRPGEQGGETGGQGGEAGQGAHRTIIVQQHVLGLEVSVDNVPLVQVLQAADDLGCVEDGARFLEAGVLLVHVVDVVPAGRPRGVCVSLAQPQATGPQF